jgi:hypothetical protein
MVRVQPLCRGSWPVVLPGDQNATGYSIEYLEGDAQEWTVLDTTTSTSYAATGLDAGGVMGESPDPHHVAFNP